MWWRPAHEWRGTRQPWFANPALNEVGMSELAAKVIYRCFNLLPDLVAASNDRDQLRW
jgi:hypothetical protein